MKIQNNLFMNKYLAKYLLKHFFNKKIKFLKTVEKNKK